MTLPAPSAAEMPSPEGALRRIRFPALGTTCEVQYAAPADPAKSAQFEFAATNWVRRFEARYSRFRPDSLVTHLNQVAGRQWVAVDAEMEHMLDLCDAVYRMTDGVMDPTILPLLRAWDWKAAHPVIPTAPELARARSLVGWTKVQREPGRVFLPLRGMALDFGGFGKEYAVDIVAQMALDHGIASVLVDFGHDLRAVGTPPGRPAWHLGLENPHFPGEIAGSLALRGNAGVASSGDYLRCFHAGGRRYGHIIDPRTGWPVDNTCLQSTVIADTCLQAGVLSTTAFVLGLPRALEYVQGFPQAEGFFVTETARAQTRGFHQYVAT